MLPPVSTLYTLSTFGWHSGRAIKDIAVFFGEQLVTESLLEFFRAEKSRFTLETRLFFILKEELAVFGVESSN